MAYLEEGLIQVYTGNGKGKSTASFGLALRAVGCGMKVGIVQFMKKGEGYGELDSLAKLNIDVYSYGSGRFVGKNGASELDLNLAKEAMQKVAEMYETYDLIIMDEVNNALHFGLVTEEDVIELVKQKPDTTELVLTGRNAPEAICEMADLVTEMREVKHPFSAGINARRGIEF